MTDDTDARTRAGARGDNPLGFALDFLGGKAHVTLGRRRLGGMVRLDQLALEVPNVSFPFDVSGGAGRFRHRRCRLRRLEAWVEAEAFSSWFTAQERLEAYGFRDVSLRWQDGLIRLEGVARLGDRQVPFTARLTLVPAGGLRLRLTLDRWRPYAYLPLPPPLLGVGLLTAAGIRKPADDEPRPLVAPDGASQVELDLLGLVLRQLLPTHGWRLPDTVGVVIERLMIGPDGLQVVYAAPEDISTDVSGVVRALDGGDREQEGDVEEGSDPIVRTDLGLLATQEATRRFAEGEQLIADGDVAGALAYYEGQHRETPDDPFVLQRRLELLACSPHTVGQARRLARRVVADRPEYETALFVLAAAAEELGEPVDAASRYAALASLAEQRGEVREAVLATLACGRLLSATDPEQAISWYERALAMDPDLPAAVQALIGLYRSSGRIPDLLRLQRRTLARATGRRERLRGHLTLGAIYLYQLEDPLRARAEYERAVRLDNASLPAWNGLAEAHRVAGDHERERRALERVVAQCDASGDVEALSLARRRVAQAWADADDIGRALEVTGELVDRTPRDLDALELHGVLSGRAGQWEAAAETLERLLTVDTLPRERRAQVALELARIRLEGLADPEGARIFVEASLAAEELDGALELAGRLAEAEGRHAELAEVLGRRAERESDEGARAALLLQRASVLHDPLGDSATALVCLEPVVSSELPIARDGLRLAAQINRAENRNGALLRALQALSVHVFGGGSGPLPEEVSWMLTLGELLAQVPTQRDEAKRQLRRLHAAVPGDPRPLIALTELLTDRAEQAEREGLLERLVDITEDKGDGGRQAAALRELGELRWQQHRLEDAAVALGAAARLSPDDADLLLALGSVTFEREQWDEAERVFGKLQQIDSAGMGEPGLIELRLGQLAGRRGEHEAAIGLLRKALGQQPRGITAAECHDALQEGLARAGRWAEAADSMEAAAADQAADLDDATRVDRLFTAAEIRRRRLDESERAGQLCEEILQRQPEHLGALNTLTVLAAASEGWEDVARLLERKIDLLGDTSDVVTLLDELAVLYAERLDRPQAARSTYERVLALDDEDRAALRFVGRDARTCGDRAAAERSYARLLELGPDPAQPPEAQRAEELEIHRALAQLALADSRIEDVETHLTAVLELDPADREALELLDDFYTGERQWRKLADVIRRRAEREPHAADAVTQLLRLAVVLEERLEQPRESAAVCREILRRDPDHVGALTRLAGVLRALREDPVGRRQALERILGLRERGIETEDVPPRGELLFELGTLLREELGEPAAGAELLAEALTEGCQELALLRGLVALARGGDSPGELDAALGRLAEHTDDPGERRSAVRERAELRLDALNDPAAALEVLEELEPDERPDEVYALAARSHEARGDYQAAYGAQRELAQRAEAKGDRAVLLGALESMLALAAESLDDAEAVAETAQRILVLRGDHPGALGRLVEGARRRRSADDLLEALDRQIAAATDEESGLEAELNTEAARLCLLVPGRAAQAAKRAEAALQREPAHGPARFQLAAAAAAQGDFDTAARTLDELGRRLKAERAAAPEKRTFVGGVYRELARLHAERLDDPARARKAWRVAAGSLEGEPLARVLERWARAAAVGSEWAETAEVQEWLRDLRSEASDALALAEAYEHLGRLDDALRALRDAPPARDAPGQAPGELARELRSRERALLSAAGRSGELARSLEEEARRAELPSRRHALLLEAAEHYLERAGEVERAERCLLLVLDEQPRSTDAVERLIELGRSAGSGRRIQEALRRVADQLYAELAPRLEADGEPPEGEPAEALALLSRIADFWLDTPDVPEPDAAFAWLERVVHLAPERVEDLLRLAEHQQQAGDFEALAALLGEAVCAEALPAKERHRLGLRRVEVLADRLDRAGEALALLDELPATAAPETRRATLERKVALLEQLDRLEEAEQTLVVLAETAEAPRPLLERAVALASKRSDAAARIGHLWRLVETIPQSEEALDDALEELARASAQQQDAGGEVSALERLVALESAPRIRAQRLAALGRALAESEQWPRAQERLGEAAELAPTESDIQLLLADVASRNRDLKVARLALATAHDLLPEEDREERSEISLRRSQVERELDGDCALSRRYARQAAEETRVAEHRARALRTVITLSEDQQDTAHEEQALRDLFDLGVAEPPEIDRLAALCEGRAAWTEALGVYEHLRLVLPEESGVLRRLAKALQATGSVAQAAEVLADAAELSVKQGERARAADDLVVAAALLTDTEDGAERARELLLQALEHAPEHEDAFRRGQALCRQLGDRQHLLEFWTLRLPSLDDVGRQQAYGEMATVALQDDDLDGAARYWALGLTAARDDAHLLAKLVVYHADRQEWVVAWDYGQRLDGVGGAPEAEALDVHAHLADVAFALADRPGARQQLRCALQVAPESEEIATGLERLLVEDEAYDELLELLELRSVQRSGSERAALLLRAAELCETHLERPEDALRYFQQSLLADGEQDAVRARLLVLLRDSERWSELRQQLEQSLRRLRGPEQAAVADELADISLHHLGDPEAAQRYRRHALQAAPSDVGRLRALVDLLANQRQWAELVELLEEALDTMVLDADSAAGFFALLGRTYLEKLECPDQGVAVFERARARGALSPRSGELLAEVYESNGRFADLAALLEELAERSPEGSVTQRLLVKRARVLADHLGHPAEAAQLLLELFRIAPDRRRKLGRMARKLLVRAKLHADALTVLDEELSVVPDTERAALHLERGTLLETALDRSADALDEYLRVLELTSGQVEAHLGAARIYLERGANERALPHAEAAIRSADGSPAAEAHVLASEVCIELHRVAEAVEHLEFAVRLDPTNLEVIQELGRHYTAQGEWEKLAEVTGREIALTAEDTTRGRLWYRRALLYRDILNRGGDALRCFREAVAADSGNVEAVAALRDFALERGDWETSLSLLERELEAERDPTARAQLQLKRADLLENRLARVDEAIGAVQDALALVGGQAPDIQRTLARLLASTQQWPEAAALEKELALAAGTERQRAEGQLRAAALFERAEQSQDAFELYREVVGSGQPSVMPEAVERLLRAAKEPPVKRQVVVLFESLLPGLSPGPLRHTLLRHLVQLATELGEQELAEQHAEALFAEDPNDRSAFMHRRRVLERQQDHAALVALMDRRLPVASAEERLDLLMALGALLRDRLGDLERAAGAFDRILDIRPDDLAALDARADLAFSRAEFAEAAELYERLGDGPCSLEASDLAYRRGAIAEALGDEEQALAHYDSAIQKRAGHLGALEAQARLQLLHKLDADAEVTLTALLEVVPPSDPERALATGVQLARVQLRLGKADAAAQGLELLYSRHPETTSTLRLLAEVYRSGGRWSALADTLERLVGASSERRKRARLLFEQGQLRQEQLHDQEGAAKCFLRAADLDPEEPAILGRVAEHYARRGRWDEMRDAYAQQRQLLESRPGVQPVVLATSILGSALAGLLVGGEEARDAPAVIRELTLNDLHPNQVTRLLAHLVAGLHLTRTDGMALRRVFDLMDSALGRNALPAWSRSGERLLAEDPTDTALRRLQVRLCARLGDGMQAANHQAVLDYLEGAPADAELTFDEAGAEARSSRVLRKSVSVFGPAIPDAANVPLRSVMAGLHPQLGRLAAPIDPSELGPELDADHGPELFERLEQLKELLQPGPVGAVFARRPRAPVEVLFSLPPVLLVDPRLKSWPAPQSTFLIARALELIRSGALLALEWPLPRVARVLDTVAQIFEIPLPGTAQPDAAILRRLQDRGFSTEHYDNATMEGLQVAFFNHFRDPTELEAYRQASLHAANRIGLLAAGKLGPALHALTLQLHLESGAPEEDYGVLDIEARSGLVATQSQLPELMGFGTSSLYPTLLRRRVTLPRR